MRLTVAVLLIIVLGTLLAILAACGGGGGELTSLPSRIAWQIEISDHAVMIDNANSDKKVEINVKKKGGEIQRLPALLPASVAMDGVEELYIKNSEGTTIKLIFSESP